MSTDLISILQQNTALVQTGVDEDTLAVAGCSGNQSKRISIKGGVFRKVVGGKEVALIEDRHMDVIFVKMAHDPSRMFYSSGYKEGEKVSPVCWSSNSKTPDKEVKTPQAPTCDSCKHSVKGSGPNGTGTACRISWRTAVVLPSDPAGDVLQLVIPGKSCWGEGDANRRPFQPYIRNLKDLNISKDVLVTKMSFDTRSEAPRLLFSMHAPVPPELRDSIVKQSQSLAAEQAVKLTVYQAPENLLDDGAPSAPAIAPTVVASTTTAPPVQATPQPTPVVQPVVQGDVIVEEPVLRPSETPAQPQVKDVSSILSKWGAKS